MTAQATVVLPIVIGMFAMAAGVIAYGARQTTLAERARRARERAIYAPESLPVVATLGLRAA